MKDIIDVLYKDIEYKTCVSLNLSKQTRSYDYGLLKNGGQK